MVVEKNKFALHCGVTDGLFVVAWSASIQASVYHFSTDTPLRPFSTTKPQPIPVLKYYEQAIIHKTAGSENRQHGIQVFC